MMEPDRCAMPPAAGPREAAWVGDSLVEDLPEASTCLSVGEGYGQIALRIAQHRPDLRVIAIDLSLVRLAHARVLQRRLGIENVWFGVADVTNLPFVDGAFEAGYARGVLHIVPDPRSAVHELRRVLRSRLFVDQLANRPFFALWFWLLQRYENLRARLQRRPPERGIWQDVVDTTSGPGTYRSLWGYRRWFAGARKTRVRANCLFIWETGRHRPILGWTGYAGGIDVWL
jgi:SAM-dependent methyltransferase